MYLCPDRLGEEPMGDILYFDYGCIAFWGLTQKQEQVRPVPPMFLPTHDRLPCSALQPVVISPLSGAHPCTSASRQPLQPCALAR